MRRRLWAALFSLAGLAACAGGAQELEAQRLAKNVELLQQNQARQASRLEELQNRLVVLSEQQKRRDQGPAPGALEVVRLAPPGVQSDRGPESVAEAEASLPPIEITLRGEGDPPRLAVTPLPPPPANRSSADPLRKKSDPGFERAMEAYAAGKLAAAYDDLVRLSRDRDDDLATTARFWMGLCQFDLGAWERAAEDFAAALARAPQHVKAADALFKAGIAFERLGKSDQARDNFARLVREHPDSALVELARARLAQGAAR